MTAESISEARNRTRRAQELRDLLVEWKIPLAKVRQMNEQQWTLANRGVQARRDIRNNRNTDLETIKAPSVATRAAVIALMEPK